MRIQSEMCQCKSHAQVNCDFTTLYEFVSSHKSRWIEFDLVVVECSVESIFHHLIANGDGRVDELRLMFPIFILVSCVTVFRCMYLMIGSFQSTTHSQTTSAHNCMQIINSPNTIDALSYSQQSIDFVSNHVLSYNGNFCMLNHSGVRWLKPKLCVIRAILIETNRWALRTVRHILNKNI